MSRCFFIFMMILSVRGSKDYCDEKYCNNSKQHTLCKYQSNQPASNCLSYQSLLKNRQDKLSILHKINERRNKVASGDIRSFPSAENMMALVWNEELEKSAQRWADQCVQHSSPDIKDTCRDLALEISVNDTENDCVINFGRRNHLMNNDRILSIQFVTIIVSLDLLSVGQNIATVFGDAPGLSPVSLVDVWYTELLNLNATIVVKYKPSIEVSSSHYDYFTQLVWAESREVGCGAVKFIGSGMQKNKTIHRLVCNFAPVGNKIGESVYLQGVPCSICPNNSQCDTYYKFLCRSNTIAVSLSFSKKSNDHTFSVEDDITTTDRNNRIHKSNLSASTSDDILTMFDYLSQLNTFSRQMVTSASTVSSCKNVFALDELVELLKKKLSTDPIFKEVLSNKKDTESELGVTDANVAAFVNRLYSKKVLPTSAAPEMHENINSTLLTELVEAIIFRNTANAGKQSTTETIDLLAAERIPVSPVKIQAELAQVKSNDYFTGHYFFPEDESEDKANSDLKENEYDINTEVVVSDVMSELQDLKNQLQTKDFVEEILESDVAT